MNEKWTRKAQEVFDATPQEERERMEDGVRSVWEEAGLEFGFDPEDREGGITDLCVFVLARGMADADAVAAEFMTEEVFERYAEEEYERLVKLPEYSEGRTVPVDALDEAVQARFVSEHPAAARYVWPPKQQH